MQQEVTMQSVKDKITALRSAMEQQGIQAYMIPSSDPHMGEYVPTHWEARRYFSGFTGSAGTLVVTAERSGLWTDGRYFIQAARQLKDSGIELFKMRVAGVPTVEEFLVDTLRPGECVGFDGRMLSASQVVSMRDLFAEKNISIRSADLIAPLWPDRPPMPKTEIYEHEVKFAGLGVSEKLAQVRQALKEQHADGQIYAKLDCTAWLMNLRAADIEDTPLAVSYSAVFGDAAYLFLDPSRLTEKIRQSLSAAGVTVRNYEEIWNFPGEIQHPATVLVDMTGINYELYRLMKKNPHIDIKGGPDLVANLKGIKNPTEIENIRKTMLYDGRAMVKYSVELERRLNAGKPVTEWDVCEMLKKYRAAEPGNLGESFGTIAAYRENAAMMHYSPKPDSCSALEKKGLLLVDSGGQYLTGTTDITRTCALGPVSHEEKENYTRVLQAHISLATAVFLEGTTGGGIDILCREPLWRHGIDYRCGTGHGVGMLGTVHEGPQNIRPKNGTALVPGMTVTNEPGVYEEGKHGIRTENMMLVTEALTNEYGKFLKFETLTCFPIDTAPLLPELLTNAELQWLNDYHAWVWKKLSPLLEGKELTWLEEHTRPVKRG